MCLTHSPSFSHRTSDHQHHNMCPTADSTLPDNLHGKHSATSNFKTIGAFDLHSPRLARYIAPSPCLIFIGSLLLHACLCDHVNPFLFFLLQMAMALIDFNTLLDHLQSPYSLPGEMLTSQGGLHFGDIHFVPPWHTLNMQHVSLTYLKSLISDNCFQPEGTPSDAAGGSTAILLIFLSDEQHTIIQHIHLSLVVHKSIEEDLKKVRQKWDLGVTVTRNA